jgi:hypothetical protein
MGGAIRLWSDIMTLTVTALSAESINDALNEQEKARRALENRLKLKPETVESIDRFIQLGPADGVDTEDHALRLAENIWEAVKEALG